MERIGLVLTPLDTLFFRDGRPFNAADQAVGGLPTPMPLAGALRTAILANHPDFNFGEFTDYRRAAPKDIAGALVAGGMNEPWYMGLRIRGPFLALKSDHVLMPLLPVPNSVVRTTCDKSGKEVWLQAEPLMEELPGWKSPEGTPHLRPLWRKNADNEKHPGGFLTLDAIRLFLSGKTKQITDQDWFRPDDLFKFDGRTGIEVEPYSFTAADSRIYGIQLLALMTKVRRNWCANDNNSNAPRYNGCRVVLYAEVLHEDGPTDLVARITGSPGLPLPLGGEGHYVRSESVTPVDWPGNSGSGKKVWYMGTPGFFSNAAASSEIPMWVPDEINADNLRAASTGNPVAVSGWDVARKGPRPTRFAVPAGSVFYSEDTSVPDHQSLCSDENDIAEGWGFVLTGDWT